MDVPQYLLDLQDGDTVLAEHVRDLARLHQERQILVGANMRRQIVPGQGTLIEVEPGAPAIFAHPWLPQMTGGSMILAPGLCNTTLPWLADDAGPLRPMDGKTEKGEDDPKGVPRLALDERLYDDLGYSFIVLRVYVDYDKGTAQAAKDGGITLAQTAVQSWQDGVAIDLIGEDGRHYGDEPLVQLRRPASDKTGFGQITQVSHFNKRHRFARANANNPGEKDRHLFWV